MKVGFAQINTTVGDLGGNCEKILSAYRQAVALGAELVLTPELAIAGYPPRDLVFKSQFVPRNLEILERLHCELGEVPLLTGFVDYNQNPQGRPFRNAAALLQRGRPVEKFYKSLLPVYDVFDEARYFEPEENTRAVEWSGKKLGITICEDIWTQEYLPRRLYAMDPVANLLSQGVEAVINISASPFNLGKPRRRFEMLSRLAAQHRVPIFYCNLVGGNDQLVFDGNSLAIDAQGKLFAQLHPFREHVAVIDTETRSVIDDCVSRTSDAPVFQSDPEDLFHALSLGVRDYLGKCGFKSAVIGLSGGIDSAVTAAIAVDALGPENVLGVSMPTQFSSQGSIDDALALAKNLGIRCLQVPIQLAFEMLKGQFGELFAGLPEDTTEENIQPRLRAATLMAISNKFNHLLLTTGNKSELAVGYCTIYGDMAGGLAVISDVPKTKIYELAKWINANGINSSGSRGRSPSDSVPEIIPANTISKPPSAELKPDQTDQDTLPPYELLDEILHLYVEENLDARDIVKRGYDEKTVRWIQRRVDLSEYKRGQAAPGLKVTTRAFGIGRRMPIAQRFVD